MNKSEELLQLLSEVKSWRRLFDAADLQNARHEANAYKSKSILVQMHPNEFNSWVKRTRPDEYKVDRVIRSIGKWSIPFINIELDKAKGTAEVYGHEGRHRAFWLLDNGYTSMPVVIRTYNLRWDQQDDPALFDYVENWPTTLKSEDGRVGPFPWTRGTQGAMI